MDTRDENALVQYKAGSPEKRKGMHPRYVLYIIYIFIYMVFILYAYYISFILHIYVGSKLCVI